MFALQGCSMYQHNEKQLKIEEFELPFAGELNKENRWVVLNGLIPWDLVEEEYLTIVSKKLGAPAFSARVAFGSLLIKSKLNLSDRETVLMISENPYLQFFIGFSKFIQKDPFDASMLTYFRKRFFAKSLLLINEEIHRREILQKQSNENESNDSDSDDDNNKPTPPFESKEAEDNQDSSADLEYLEIKKKGKLLLDATAIPADIAYPNDIKLINKARERTEKVIDLLFPETDLKKKPRTYRKVARRNYLEFSRSKRRSYSKIRQYQRKQLGYLERNLRSITLLLESSSLEILDKVLYKSLLVSTEVSRQQREMYDTKTKRIDDRIVSISQPHIRPIKRGKEHAPTEFGAKISISLIDGYVFVDTMSFDSYNEAGDLSRSAENYKRIFGYYPASIHADQIYRNRNNIAWCKARGIRLSGPKLGRPSAAYLAELEHHKKEMKQDEKDRIPVEGKFGELKRKYGLDRIMTKLAQTTLSAINFSVLVANLGKVCRFFWFLLFSCIKSSKNDLFLCCDYSEV